MKLNFIEMSKSQIEQLKEKLKNNTYILEDESIRDDTKKYSEVIYETGILKGKIEGLELALSFFKKTS